MLTRPFALLSKPTQALKVTETVCKITAKMLSVQTKDRKKTKKRNENLAETKKVVSLHSQLLMECGGWKKGLVVQLVRIHACHAWGREFESRPDRFKKRKMM